SHPIAFVMEQTLGNVTHYLNLRQHEDASDTCRPRWFPIEYRDSRLPWTVTGSLIARRTVKLILDEVDGLFIHTLTLAPLVSPWFRKKPTVLSCDGTPLSKHAMRQAYGQTRHPAFIERAKDAVHRRIFSDAVGYVAWSNWAKASLVEDYGCREEDIQ